MCLYVCTPTHARTHTCLRVCSVLGIIPFTRENKNNKHIDVVTRYAEDSSDECVLAYAWLRARISILSSPPPKPVLAIAKALSSDWSGLEIPMKLNAVVLALALVGLASAYPTWLEDGYSDLQAEGGPPSAAPRAEMNAFDRAENGFSDLQSEGAPPSAAPRAEMNAFDWAENGFSDLQSEGAPPSAAPRAEINAFDWAENGFSDLQSEGAPPSAAPRAELDAFLETENIPFEFGSEEEAGPYESYVQSNEDPQTVALQAKMNQYPAVEMSDFGMDDEPMFVQQETVPMPGGVQAEDFGMQDEPSFFQQETVPKPGEEAETQAEDLIRLQEYIDARMRQPAGDMMEYAELQDDFA